MIVPQVLLNCSLAFYLTYFFPQLLYNCMYEAGARHISLLTQSLMILASTLDLTYGVGFNLAWQYQLVSCVSLVGLFVQDMLIFRSAWKYHHDRRKVKHGLSGFGTDEDIR